MARPLSVGSAEVLGTCDRKATACFRSRPGCTRPNRTLFKPSVTCRHERQTQAKLSVESPARELSGVFGAAAALAIALGSWNVVVPSALAADTISLQQELDARTRKSVGDIPLDLSASDDPSEPFEQQYRYKAPVKAKEDLSLTQRLQRWRESKGFTRNIIEYAAIAIVAWRYQAAKKPDAAAIRLGVWDKESANALVGTRWRLKLDVGREVGTWMPASWAASGRRIEIPCAIALEEGGVVRPLGVGAYIRLKLLEGTWNVDGDTLRFNLQISGFERGDISLPEGKLYFRTYVWGNMLSQTKGKLLLMQRRALVRREWRTVGSFKAEQIPEDEADAALQIPAARVKEGDVVFPQEF
uniref:Uncharacterized protein n=1 Tax=Pyramimonas obovata TaxID=1411642 RepID=A0A7S0N3P3_9CHLO